MNQPDRLAQIWLDWIVAASWQLAILVCLVAVMSWALARTSPRLRYGLWLLVLIKAFLPPTLTTPWSIGRWVTPLAGSAGTTLSSVVERAPLPMGPLWVVWAAGICVIWVVIAWRHRELQRLIRSATPLDEGPVRVMFEQLALDLGIRRVPELFVTSASTSPFLCGVFRPTVVLPEKSLAELDETELKAVLAHELVHYQRGDNWVGWLQVIAQSLFWFHPLVWWASSQLRHQRECVCDETVLRFGHIPAQHYGESIVRVLTASRGRSLVAGSLVGIFERGSKLQERLEEIMSYEPHLRTFGWPSRVVLTALAVLILPMADKAADKASIGAPPRIVASVPAVGATGVDPSLKEISVTFDRDMGKGMSWTGGPPEFPPIDESRKPNWKDARTCVLPVNLESGKFYRVGINSTSHQNFRAADGATAAPTAIYFATKDAAPEVENQARIPEVASMEPKNGAMDVDPQTTELRVTFNMPMGEGMSWTGGGTAFPKIAAGKKPSWSKDGLMCTLPVTLEPGHDYELGINSKSHNNFQSKAGVPLKPMTYKFRTAPAQK